MTEDDDLFDALRPLDDLTDDPVPFEDELFSDLIQQLRQPVGAAEREAGILAIPNLERQVGRPRPRRDRLVWLAAALLVTVGFVGLYAVVADTGDSESDLAQPSTSAPLDTSIDSMCADHRASTIQLTAIAALDAAGGERIVAELASWQESLDRIDRRLQVGDITHDTAAVERIDAILTQVRLAAEDGTDQRSLLTVANESWLAFTSGDLIPCRHPT